MKEKNVVDFYITCTTLKNVIRTGWRMWNVDADRIESVAEHVYGTQMLALAMYSEYNYDIDIMKVLYMLAIHELEECLIGDLVYFETTPKDKKKQGHEAVHKILSPLNKGKYIEELVLEFDERESKEAKFAYYCDKLECDIQCKLYDEAGCVDVEETLKDFKVHDPLAAELLERGVSWSTAWITNDQDKIKYEDNFNRIAEYIKNNEITSNLQ